MDDLETIMLVDGDVVGFLGFEIAGQILPINVSEHGLYQCAGVALVLKFGGDSQCVEIPMHGGNKVLAHLGGVFVILE